MAKRQQVKLNIRNIAGGAKLLLLLVLVGFTAHKTHAQALIVNDSVITLDEVLHKETIHLTLNLSNTGDFPIEVIEIHNNKPPKFKLPWWGKTLIASGKTQKIDILFTAPKGDFVALLLLESTDGSRRITIKGHGTDPILKEDQGTASKVMTFYPDGKTFATYEDMRDSKSPNAYNTKHYKYTYHYRNGQICNILTFKGGKFNEYSFYPSGKQRATGDFKGTLKRPLKEGEWTFWHPSGKVAAEGKYKYGLKTGYHQEWYENGECQLRARYKVARMAQQDKANEAVLIRRQSSAEWFESYYEDGTKRYDYREIKRGGIYFAYYPNGQLNQMLFHKKGVDQIDNRYCYDGTVISELDLYRGVDKKGQGKATDSACYPYAKTSLLDFFKPYLLPF